MDLPRAYHEANGPTHCSVYTTTEVAAVMVDAVPISMYVCVCTCRYLLYRNGLHRWGQHTLVSARTMLETPVTIASQQEPAVTPPRAKFFMQRMNDPKEQAEPGT